MMFRKQVFSGWRPFSFRRRAGTIFEKHKQMGALPVPQKPMAAKRRLFIIGCVSGRPFRSPERLSYFWG